MAYPVIRSTSQGHSSLSLSQTFTLPSGHQEGDLLILMMAFSNASQSSFSLAGWTLLVTPTSQLSGLARRIYTRTRAASEPSSYTATWTNSQNTTWAVIAIEAGTWDPNAGVSWNHKSQTGGRMTSSSLTSSFGNVPQLKLQIFAYTAAASALNSNLNNAAVGSNYYVDTTYQILIKNRANVNINWRGLFVFSKESDLAASGTLYMDKQGNSASLISQLAIKGLEASASGPDLAVNIGGAWKTSSEISVNIGGVWKTASNVFVNIGGVWKESTAQAKQWVYITFTSSAPAGSDIYDVMSGSGINDALAFLDANYPASGRSIGTVASIRGNDDYYVTCEVQGV
jgi:hypothetical protein